MRDLWDRFNQMMNMPPTPFGMVMWVMISALLAVILFFLAMHAGQGVAL